MWSSVISMGTSSFSSWVRVAIRSINSIAMLGGNLLASERKPPDCTSKNWARCRAMRSISAG
jgi:hypothetical protein